MVQVVQHSRVLGLDGSWYVAAGEVKMTCVVAHQVAIVGIEPETLLTGIGLSAKVEAALPEAAEAADRMLHEPLAFAADETSSCTK